MGFAVLPQWLIRSPEWTPLHKAILGVLSSYHGDDDDAGAFPFARTIARQVPCNLETCRAALRELKTAGLVTASPRFDARGGQTSNAYTLNFSRWNVGAGRPGPLGGASTAPAASTSPPAGPASTAPAASTSPPAGPASTAPAASTSPPAGRHTLRELRDQRLAIGYPCNVCGETVQGGDVGALCVEAQTIRARTAGGQVSTRQLVALAHAACADKAPNWRSCRPPAVEAQQTANELAKLQEQADFDAQAQEYLITNKARIVEAIEAREAQLAKRSGRRKRFTGDALEDEIRRFADYAIYRLKRGEPDPLAEWLDNAE